MMSLLDRAQIYWFSRFLAAPKDITPIVVPYEIYTWAIPKHEWDGYPNLATVTWPG